MLEKPFDLDFNYSIYLKNYTSGKHLLINQRDKMPSSSIRKIFIMTAVLAYLEDKGINLNETVPINLNGYEITDSLSGVLQYLDQQKKGLSYNDLLHLMITYSDVLATKTLGDIVGIKKLNEYNKKHQFHDTKHYYLVPNVDSNDNFVNVSSAYDVGMFFEKLFLGENGKEIKSLGLSEFNKSVARKILMRQQFNDQIPEFIPETVTVAHKHGWGLKNMGDAGVFISKENNDVLGCLVILLDKIDSPTLTQKQSMVYASRWIADISSLLYNEYINYHE